LLFIGRQPEVAVVLLVFQKYEIFKKINIIFKISFLSPGVDRFVNFGYRPWWYGGHFCQKARKNMGKKIISKRNNLKKRKKPGGGSKIRNKLCIKMRFFMYTH